MTEKYIIKALERCTTNSCAGCPAGTDSPACVGNVMKEALDLIIRQQAEIERLKGWERLLKAESHAPIIKKAKAEAYKEFAERLKANDFFANFTYKGEARLIIDNLVEEMEKGGEG